MGVAFGRGFRREGLPEGAWPEGKGGKNGDAAGVGAAMASYRVRVRTGTQPGAGTADSISITLVGTRGCSPKTPLDGWGPDFCCGGVSGRGRLGGIGGLRGGDLGALGALGAIEVEIGAVGGQY